jgi:hypothetical protein
LADHAKLLIIDAKIGWAAWPLGEKKNGKGLVREQKKVPWTLGPRHFLLLML